MDSAGRRASPRAAVGTSDPEDGELELQAACKDLGYDGRELKAGKVKYKKLQQLCKQQQLNARKPADWMINALVLRWEQACGGDGGNAAGADGQDDWYHATNAAGNVVEATSIEHMQALMRKAEDESRLVVVDFFKPSCVACKAMYPKLLQLADEYGDSVQIIKVNTQEQVKISRTMGIQSVPYFHCFNGAAGHVASFTCNLMQVGKLRKALQLYGTPRVDLSCPWPPPESWPWFRFGLRPKTFSGRASSRTRGP